MQNIFKLFGLFCFIAILFSTPLAHAGMMSVVLTEYGQERLTGLSTALFFGLVVSTLLVRLFWGLLVEGTNWPKPTMLKSFAATFLGGLLFFIVLVMIAGSRELFSPGAWVPDGILYKLAAAPETESESEIIDPALSDVDFARRKKIEKLRNELQALSESESGLPTEIPADTTDNWIVPFSSGMLYEYHPQSDSEPYLVAEPKILGGNRLAIGRGFEIVEILENSNEQK